MQIHQSAIKRWLGATVTVLTVAVLAAGCGSSSSKSSSSSSGGGGATTASGASSASGASTSSSSSGSASTATDVSQLKVGALNFDMSKYCGSKPFKVGLIDGFGGNTWRVEVHALVTKLAESCKNNTGVEYFDANLDPQKYNSTIQSWAVSGVNVIVTFDDFGQSAVPAYHQAEQQGVKVVTDNAIPGNAVVGTDVDAAIEPNFSIGSKLWVQFLNKALHNKGQIVLVGGPAGNLFDPPAIADVQKSLAATHSGLKLALSTPQYAGWDPATTQKVMSSLLSTHPDINGVILTYMATAPSIIRAYQEAGRPLPAIVGQSSSNQVVCQIRSLDASGKKVQEFSLDGSANQAAIALAKGVASYQGISAPELGPTNAPTISNYATYIDTLTGKIPTCIKSLPAGADLSAALTQPEITAAVK
jgi:ribose transport system substrate-binding protein